MDILDKLTHDIITFRDKRNWKQFHNPKDVAISLSLEAAELLEHYQWKSDKEVKEYIKNHADTIGDELADVFYWVLLLSHDLKIDIVKAVESKLKKNEIKYPVEKAKGSHKKYTELI